jgi:hypothetical protein
MILIQDGDQWKRNILAVVVSVQTIQRRLMNVSGNTRDGLAERTAEPSLTNTLLLASESVRG